MSDVLSQVGGALSSASGAVTGALSSLGLAGTPTSLLIQAPRKIGTIIPQIVVEEQHHDQLVVTEHPVELGAPIADHAYKAPAEVTIHCGWSNSFGNLLSQGAGQLLSGDFSGLGDTLASAPSMLTEDYVRTVYTKLQTLQASLEPFDLVTGKRSYKNMMMTSLGVSTDHRSEYTLMVTATFREVIRVQIVTTSLPPGASAQAQPANPASMNPATDRGAVEPAQITPPLAGSAVEKANIAFDPNSGWVPVRG